MPFPPGTMVAGKYRVERLLGEGGMGWVVLATHLHLEQRVALKFMRPTPDDAGTDAIRRFVREARAAARVQSEHVARVSDVGTVEDGTPYLVMEYLEGENLETLLREATLPVSRVVEYVMQACEGLSEVHLAGIVHRDLKPANLFLARRSDGSVRVKLLDFGISKIAASDGSMTSTQALMGSPLYMAPEQMRSSKRVDARADIWSMGVILFEMLAGRSPFTGETLPEICARIIAEPPDPEHGWRPDVPAALEDVVLRCLEKDPARRYQHVGELAQALAPFGGAEAHSTADRIDRVSRAQRPASSLTPVSADPSEAATRIYGSGPRRDGAHTAASFGIAEPASTSRRSMARPLTLGALVVLAAAGLVAVIGVGEGGRPPVVNAASAPPAMSEGWTAAVPRASAAPEAPAVASLDASEDAVAPSTPRPDPSPPAARRSQPRLRPPPVPSSSARPSSTSGFGGRD